MVKPKSDTSIDPVEAKLKQVSASVAKRQFVSVVFDMGWRLAVAVIVPLVLGVKADEHFNSSPLYTLLGMLLAAALGSVTVWNSVKSVNSSTSEGTKKKGKDA